MPEVSSYTNSVLGNLPGMLYVGNLEPRVGVLQTNRPVRRCEENVEYLSMADGGKVLNPPLLLHLSPCDLFSTRDKSGTSSSNDLKSSDKAYVCGIHKSNSSELRHSNLSIAPFDLKEHKHDICATFEVRTNCRKGCDV